MDLRRHWLRELEAAHGNTNISPPLSAKSRYQSHAGRKGRTKSVVVRESLIHVNDGIVEFRNLTLNWTAILFLRADAHQYLFRDSIGENHVNELGRNQSALHIKHVCTICAGSGHADGTKRLCNRGGTHLRYRHSIRSCGNKNYELCMSTLRSSTFGRWLLGWAVGAVPILPWANAVADLRSCPSSPAASPCRGGCAASNLLIGRCYKRWAGFRKIQEHRGSQAGFKAIEAHKEAT